MTVNRFFVGAILAMVAAPSANAVAATRGDGFLPCGAQTSPDGRHLAVLRLRSTAVGDMAAAYLCDAEWWCDELAYVPADRHLDMRWRSDGALMVGSPDFTAGRHRAYPPGGGRPVVEFRRDRLAAEGGETSGFGTLTFDPAKCGVAPPVTSTNG